MRRIELFTKTQKKRTMFIRSYIPGLVLIAVGFITAFGSLNYEMGTASRMGPGYYPFMLGVVLSILGAIELIGEGVRRHLLGSEEQKALDWGGIARKYGRPWFAILTGAILFILIGEFGGLVPATFVMIFVTALGDSETSVAGAGVLAICILAFTLLAFHYGMGLQFPLFRWG